MSKKPFDKFINKESGAKKREAIRQDKRQVKAELKAKGEEMNRQNEDKYRMVTSSTRRKPADDSENQSFKSKNQQSESRGRKPKAGADDFKADKRGGSRSSENSGYKRKDDKAGGAYDRKGGKTEGGYKGRGEKAGGSYKGKEEKPEGSYKAWESKGDDRKRDRAEGGYKGREDRTDKPYARKDDSAGYKAREERAGSTRSRRDDAADNEGNDRKEAGSGSEGRTRKRIPLAPGANTGRSEKPESRDRRPREDAAYDEPRRTGKAPSERGNTAEERAPKDENAPMPLNKYIAHSGICGRREAAELVKEGHVVVNGDKILEPGFKVTASDKVTIKGKQLFLQKNLVYVLLNKPKDFLTTAKDPQGRKTVLDLVKGATQERIFPVGRLDRNTTGVLLLTNDGELAQKLTHPSFEIKKIYEVKLDKPVLKKDLDAIVTGIELEDGFIQADTVGYADSKDKSIVGIEIHSGRNRIVRRIFEHLGYDVKNLDRVLFANLTKKNVDRGKWRMLAEKEVRLLKYMNQSFVKKKEKKDAAK